MEAYSIKVKVPINIALIKYWGKLCSKRMLAMNDSVSLTIDKLCAETTIVLESESENDSVIINGKPYEVSLDSKYAKVFKKVRLLIETKLKNNENQPLLKEALQRKFKIISTTNFPVASGLASSAAGFGAIAYGFGKLFNFPDNEITRLARLGSGSATRSVLPGLVIWKGGEESKCETLFPSSHCSDLRSIIVIVNESEKDIGSTKGMQRTVETSELYQYRISHCVELHVAKLLEGFEEKNFEKIAKVTMKDSNQFHAVCLDTTPPLTYMNDMSRKLINVANEFNSETVNVAYTFDAGPNCCYFIEEKNVENFLKCLKNHGFTEDAFKIIVSTVGGGPEILS